MAGAPTLNIIKDEEQQATDVSVWLEGPESAAWSPDRLNASLRANLARANHPQPNEIVEERVESADDPWRIVAPGIAVRASEYEARFAHLDLESLKNRLTPQAFRAFVRHIGIIQGPDDVDVNLLVNEEMR